MKKTTETILDLDPDAIEIGWRPRQDLGRIDELAKSIIEHQQIQPIVVSRNGSGYHLIAGRRRVAACKMAKRKVRAIVTSTPESELEALDMQLAENFGRKDFDPLELAEGLLRRKQLYEQLHPETAKGATLRRGQEEAATKAQLADSDNREPAERFTLATARSTGMSETKVKELLQLGQLPKSKKAEISKAGNSRARTMAAQKALRSIRHERKRERLEQRAAELEEKKKREQEQGAEPEVGHKIVLHLGDNRKIMESMEDSSFDLICTDPPYGAGERSLIQHVARGSISKDFGKWDKLDVGWVLRAAPLLEDGGQMLICCPGEAIGEYKLVCEAADLTYRGYLIWCKSNPGTVHRNVYLSSCEAIVWATKGDRYHFEPWENMGAPEVRNYFESPICQGNERLEHPTQKPEAVIRRLLERHAHGFSRVLDPFCGVGTTLAVCKQMGLSAVGIEQDAGYVHQARIRLAAIE